MRVFWGAILALSLMFATERELTTEEIIEKAQKEAKALAKKHHTNVINALHAHIEETALLPEEERGHHFDPDTAKKQLAQQEITLNPKEDALNQLIHASRPYTESQLPDIALADSVIANPHENIGVFHQEQTSIPEEIQRKSCIEGSSFDLTVTENRSVAVQPAIREETRRCRGHSKKEKFFFEKEAKKAMEKWKRHLLQQKGVEQLSCAVKEAALLKKCEAVCRWVHREGVSCDAIEKTAKIVQKAREVDEWHPENLEIAAFIQKRPYCRLIGTKLVKDGRTKKIEGKSIFRSSWQRVRYYTCNPGPDAKCASLREQGGELFQKRCVEDNEFGECTLWEKTYTMPSRNSYTERKLQFPEHTWATEHFSEEGEGNREFGEVLSKFSFLTQLQGNIEVRSDTPLEALLFRGESMKCRKGASAQMMFDCCGSRKKAEEGRGLGVDLGLATCTHEENRLYEEKAQGKCHFIGKRAAGTLGVDREQVYCCYPSVLARVLQEAARTQLGLDWGTPKSPNCAGLSIEQISALNFDLIDFSDVIKTLTGNDDPQGREQELRRALQAFTAESAHATTSTNIGADRE